ncbi:MAG TPA: RNA-binding transcriptional accessory protein [Tepidimicrobium sp.]|nr:RNA-binding transcriptional accessory protein [Tepidimicrobium sp.]
MDLIEILSKEFNIKPYQVENTIKLIDAGNTIPFIARYRKEQTGDLKDTILRDLFDRLNYLRNLQARQEEVIRLIDEQGKLTKDLKGAILGAKSIQRVEDLYRPYRPKRRTRATIAREKGLEELAHVLMEQKAGEEEFNRELVSYVDEEKGVSTEEDALAGAMDIIAEIISDDVEYRDIVRNIAYKEGILKMEAVEEDENSPYRMYYDYEEPVKSIANHRVLAINRGEKEKCLRVSLLLPEERILSKLKSKLIMEEGFCGRKYLEESLKDSCNRLLFPSIEREIRSSLTERAEEDAINVFALNLEPLLLQPPIRDKVVMGIDPGYRTGCKVAVMDDTGKLLSHTTVYPTPPQKQVDRTKEQLKDLIQRYGVDIIAIGNGTGSRETEQVVAQLLEELKKGIYYTIVDEAGASVYSASKVGEEEFPDLDVSIRGAISIGRRLQDPLAEFVKIEPKHIGVGQYQHDLNQTKLARALKGVVEDCVNRVGVDLNTASQSLLSYVAGISSRVALNIIQYREENGRFSNREELLDVKGLGPKTFVQCAGFLRIPGGEEPLDNTGVHPESYHIARELYDMDLDEIDETKLSKELDVGLITLRDIVEELKKPGRDPREEMPKPIFRTDVLEMEDLKLGMRLMGTVRNVVDFGAFVDIGVKQDGLIHISHLSDRYVKHPKDIVKVGDIVEVEILDIDVDRGRIALSMKEFN